MSESEFCMAAKDYGMSIEVNCTNDSGCYPNQTDLRTALDRLIFTLGHWEHVDVVIKTVEEA